MGTRIVEDPSLLPGSPRPPPRPRGARATILSDDEDTLGYRREVLPSRHAPARYPDASADDSMSTVLHAGIGLASVLTENVLSHPFIILHRQCQVSAGSAWSHLTPFSLVTPIYQLHRYQGFAWMWKGLSSGFAVKALTVCAESAISEVAGFPREVSRHSSLKKLGQVVALKSLAALIVSPFYAAALVESIQSCVASEPPGLFDVMKEGFSRLTVWAPGHATARLLPLWQVAPPTALLLTARYCVAELARSSVLASAAARNEALSLTTTEPVSARHLKFKELHQQLVAALCGAVLADVVWYPAETVLHRVLAQGSRALLDNVDSGVGVVPVSAGYDGVLQCLQQVVREEGVSGLYKGFGALVLQYTLSAALLRLGKLVMDQLETSWDPPPPPPPDLRRTRLSGDRLGVDPVRPIDRL